MLLVGAGEVDVDPVARDRDPGPDRELALLRLDDVLGLVDAVGNASDAGADDALGVGVELVHRGVDAIGAVARAQLVHTPAREGLGRKLRAQVTAALVRVPHPGHQRVEGLRVERCRRDHDALLRERPRPCGHAPRLGAADVGVMRSRHRVAERGARDERDVGKVRPAGERVVEDVDLVGPGLASGHGGDGVGHRAEVDRNVLGLRDHPPVRTEERRRAVAPLLDVGRERRAHEHGAHLLADRAQRRADHLQLDVHALFTIPSHPREQQAATMTRPIPNPHPPRGDPAGGPVQFDHGRAATRAGVRRVRAPGRGRAELGGPDGDELDRALAVGVPVALLVRRVETLGQPRRRAARRARTTGRGSEGRLRPPPGARPPRRAEPARCAPRPAARRPLPARAPTARPQPRARAPPRSRAPRRARTHATVRRRRTRRGRRRADRAPARPRRHGAPGASPRPRRARPPPGRGRRARCAAASTSSSSPPASRSGSRPSRRFASVTVGSEPPWP